MALQAKNWRLNGDFIEDPPGEPNRFDPALQEGDLALIGFDGQEWPTGAVVVLLAQSTADAILMTDLSQMVKKGIGSMVKLPPDYLQSFADRHVLPDGHVIRTLAGDPVVAAALEEIAQGDLAAATKIRKRRPSRPITAEEHAAAIEAQRLTGLLGEKLVDAHLLTAHEDGGPAHRWMWPDSAAHPYDFELLDATNAVNTVIDAKSTAHGWPADFFMSSGELDYAANSSVPYRIYRLTEVGPQGAWLRLSGDIRPFAKAVVQTFIGAAPPGTRATTIAISSTSAGLTWSDPPVRLPPAPP